MVVVSTEKGKIFTKKRKKNISVMLPEDLMIYHILPRLPLDQLFRWKVVCKKWNQFIIHTDPVFISRHFHHNPSSSTGCFSNLYAVIRAPIGVERIISSCGHKREDDAINVGLTNGFYFGFHQNSDIFIWNLFTKHAVRIPNPNNALAIALATNKPNDRFGNFMIAAMIPTCEVRNAFQFQVYSSETGEWRISKVADFWAPHRLGGIGGVYDGRKVFWCFETHIVWYDIEHDDAGMFESPARNEVLTLNSRGGPLYSAIGLCNAKNGGGGELSYSRLKGAYLGIWLLKNHNNNITETQRGNGLLCDGEFKWVKIHSLNMLECDDIMSKFIGTLDTWIYGKVLADKGSIIYPLSYIGGEVVWVWTATEKAMRFFSINLRTRHLKLIYHNDIPFAITPFIPNLIPSSIKCL